MSRRAWVGPAERDPARGTAVVESPIEPIVSTTSVASVVPVASPFAVGTTNERVLVSAVVILALLVLGVGVRRAGPALRRRVDPLLAAEIQTTVLLALTGVATLALVATWNAAGVRAALAAGPRVGVRVTVTIALFIAAALVARFLRRAIDRVAADRRDAIHGREVASYLARAGVFTIAGLLVFSVWGIDLGNLLLGAGLLGAVIGLPARQTIGSVIWGFVVLVTRPFTVGDWVAIGDREGRVAEITTTSTGLETETGDQTVIANHRIADVDVLNRSAAGRRRVDSEVTVERTRDLARAIETAEGALSDLDAALDLPAPVVAVTTADEGSTTLRLSVWISDPTPERATAVRSDAVVAVTAALERERIVGPESGSDDADGGGVNTADTNDGEPKSKLGTRRGEGGRP